MGASTRQTERTLRRLNLDNLRLQKMMLERLIAEEERYLEQEEDDSVSDYAYGNGADSLISRH